MRETETREFKRSTSELKEAVISIAAMLNKHGAGELFFGYGKEKDDKNRLYKKRNGESKTIESSFPG